MTRESYSVGNPLRIYVAISGSVRGWPIEASKSEYCLAFMQRLGITTVGEEGEGINCGGVGAVPSMWLMLLLPLIYGRMVVFQERVVFG